MKERPILFSAPMVRAILAGTKTQTRRIVKPTPQMVTDRSIQPWDGEAADLLGLLTKTGKRCPYGQPGDRLWVRETHAPQADCWGSWERWIRGEGGPAPIIRYAADREKPAFVERWRPSIHMPRWASRITLEITGVRVERLKAISEADAAAEGVATWAPGALSPDGQAAYPSEQYQWLWQSINGAESWHADPWVWVVEFRPVPSPA
jgi:hypothetical protein